VKYSTFIEGQKPDMISWRRITAKEATEVVKTRRKAAPAVNLYPELYEGNVQLEIMPFESFHQINKYTRYLATLENVKIVSEDWSEEDGFSITVSLQVPMALGNLIQDMPEVARVYINGQKSSNKNCKKMVVEMKTPAVATAPMPA
jgi:hypothetical protein